jgi:peptide deformylase
MNRKGLKDILPLGDERLYQTCNNVVKEDQENLSIWIADLDNAMSEIRAKYNFGRGIAAPQLGIMKNIIYTNIDQPKVYINPQYLHKSDEMFEVWDDCMCFPQLFVKVMRHRNITIQYTNVNWQLCEENFYDDLSELMQHEMDHLHGILCTMRAIDSKSYKWRNL